MIRALSMGLAVLFGIAATAPPSRDAPPPGLKPLLEDALAHTTRAKGMTAIVVRDGHPLYRLDIGDIGKDQAFPIASASKWLTGALVMTFVDEGKLSLDAPISKVLPTFKGEAGKITLRQVLAQTAGDGDIQARFEFKEPATITLAQSAANIAARPLTDPPGAVFRYGGPHFQIAGAMVEAITGRRWADVFDERIAKPLGMTHTSWIHSPDQTETAAQTLNPVLQAGAVTSAEDYMHFLTMIADGGVYRGKRILSAKAIDQMETNQMKGVQLGYVPAGAAGRHAQYALANWCDVWAANGRCSLVSSPGAYGATPFLDRDHKLYGILFIYTKNLEVFEPFDRAEKMILDANR